MQEKEIKEILDRYHRGECSPEEKLQVELWYSQQASNSEWNLEEDQMESTRSRILAKLNDQIDQPRGKVRNLWPRIAAAASILLLLSAGGYFILHKQTTTQETAQNQPQDAAPGSNKAILKMANGKQLIITDAKNGLLAQQGNTTISKTGDGKLAYNNSGRSSAVILYDTLIVPRGGQHQVKFSDGSIAYLNADTKLRIPENFEKSDRTVELISGEADFQVVHNSKSPFRVKVKDQMTEDIGTEFNINAYPDEPSIKTTLLEGKVKVFNKKQSSVLRPGQQASIGKASNGIKIDEVDTDEAFAWKNGKFLFSGTPLENIMRQIARWYDVDVVYQNEAIREKHFSAISTRFTNVSQVLHSLELTGEVKFKVAGKKIIVLNK